MNSKNIVIATVVILLLLTGCNDLFNDKFEKINTNPNDPVEVGPDLLLPQGIESAVDHYQSASTGMEFGNLVVQYWARVAGTNQDRYIYSNSQFSGLWNGSYAGELMDFKKIIQLGQELDNPNYQAIGTIMTVWNFSVLTDSYGDIPYSEALKGKDEEAITKPVFDHQQEIYTDLTKQLDEAQAMIVTGDHPVNGDILFGNNMMKWKKFANSLRFRLLMRISGKEEVSTELQHLVNNEPMFTGNSDNAQLTYLSDPPNRHPFTELPSGRQNQFRMSRTLIDYLDKLNDPRLEVFADTADANGSLYVGVPNGLSPEDVGEIDISRTSRIGSFFRRSETPGVLMTLAELNFLKAEAAHRGFISGSAEDYYEQGIAASLEQYDVSGLSAYLSQEEVVFDPSQALRQIGTQKWIALYGQGLEAWNEWRRTGYPDLKPSVANDNDDRIPVRMQYPYQLETTNKKHYEEVISRQGENSINTPVWWDQ